MTRTTPLRRMILQLRQIFFTDANTFISVSLHHFARKMIRARVKSYGVRSTVTLSPGNILM